MLSSKVYPFKPIHTIICKRGYGGSVRFRKDGFSHDASRGRVYIDAELIREISRVRSTANFVLVVEHEGLWQQLYQRSFHLTSQCIILTGFGQPGIDVRLLLRMLSDIQLPIFALVDCDVGGFQIMSVYCNGSQSMAHDNFRLACPGTKWFGLLPSGLRNCNIRGRRIGRDEKNDLQNLLDKPAVENNDEWHRELSNMLGREVKSCLNGRPVGHPDNGLYMINDYIPRKLQSLIGR